MQILLQKAHLKTIILSLLLLLCQLQTGYCLEYSLSPGHYADKMEYWYENPRQDFLKPMLRTMQENRQFDRPEDQMLFGAFFSRLIQKREIDWTTFADWCGSLSRSGRHMAAWALYLSKVPEAEMERFKLLDNQDGIFRRQMRRAPANLAAWAPDEPAIINMFWGAFMADGEELWLDRIIDTALLLNQNPAGRTGKTAMSAAASLWKYAPRHKKVREKLERRLENSSAQDKALLETILKGTVSDKQ